MIMTQKNIIIDLNFKHAYRSANIFVDVDIRGSCNIEYEIKYKEEILITIFFYIYSS